MRWLNQRVARCLASIIAFILASASAPCAISLAESTAKASPKASAESAEVAGPVEPAQAVGTLQLAEGFRAELVAAEPLVGDPIAMEFDENGHAYVIDVPPYNEHGKPGQKSKSTIVRLEDTDGDGKFDKRVDFAELKYPTGIFPYDGGLFVGDPPNLLYLRDTDGDGKADKTEVLYTGFGAAPAGESQLNSFRWGLDNRIHISTGLDGGEIRPVMQVLRGSIQVLRGSPDPAAGETFGQADGEVERPAPSTPVRDVRNRRILLEPRSRTFELTSGGGQYGMSFDDWGRVYVCDNSNPIQTISYDDRYIERNPLMSAPAAMVTPGPGANFKKLNKVSPPETWRRIRTQLRSEGAEVDDTYEPGRDSGAFTSACGITIYRGDAWPEEFRGDAFIGEVANNLVYHAKLTQDGLDTKSERAGNEAEFLAATDTWVRPAQFAQGPDGNLYVIDMYRQLIEGVQWVPAQVLAKMDPTAGNDRGRMYRIVHGKGKSEGGRAKPVRLGELSTAALVALLEHPNGWHRDTASRLLYERQDKAAIKPLQKMFAGSKSPLGRLHALYALDGLDKVRERDVLRGLNDEHPRVREHTLRLAERFLEWSGDIRHRLTQMAYDPDVAVRYQLAFSASGDYGILLGLLKRDGTDPRFRMALQSTLRKHAADAFQRVLDDDSLRGSQHGQEFLAVLARQIGRGHKKKELNLVVEAVDGLSEEQAKPLLKYLVLALLAEGSGASADQLTESSKGWIKGEVESLLSGARATALDAEQPEAARLEAITILGCGSFADEREAFDELLAPRQPLPIQDAVLKVLGRFTNQAVAELLITHWPALTPGPRSSAAEVLLSRPEWAEKLLAAVESGEVSRGDFDPARVALLQSHPAEKVRELAARAFAGASVAKRDKVLADYQKSLALSGDTARGRAVFEKSCSACHELEGMGTAVGADLKAVRDRGAEAILLNILDPNREVLPKFLTYLVSTSDGRAITGVITEETPNNLTLRQADGTAVSIARTDIDEMQSTGLSYMPEGLEQQIDHQAMADLLAYLMSAGEGSRGQGAASGE